MAEIAVDAKLTVLQSKSRVFKTETFVKEAGNFKDCDLFLLKLFESVISSPEVFNVRAGKDGELNCFKLETADKRHSFFIALGGGLSDVKGGLSDAQSNDIIFFKYSGAESFVRRDDESLTEYLKLNRFMLNLEPLTIKQEAADFKKLYRLSFNRHIHFPLLNPKQKQVVEIEDKNVLVQGVAGSGKTNICIDKILFAAARRYKGRVLYSTFSRGLLNDTQSKINQFKDNLKQFIEEWDAGRVIFKDKGYKKAAENRLNMVLFAEEPAAIKAEINAVILFLNNNVDYYLLEDFYNNIFKSGESIADESYFTKVYLKGLKNHQLKSRLERAVNLSGEVIYKEIYGVISGCCNPLEPFKRLTLNEYIQMRSESFSRAECELIYAVADDYYAHLKSVNLTDNNLISRALISKSNALPKYSLAVLDEVQDFTEANLCLFKTMALKLFCVGDALQMINPSYFSYAYLKRLLFEKDIVTVAELKHNYRSCPRIAALTQSLGEINVRQFGTHSFVLNCESIENAGQSSAVYISGGGFIEAAAKLTFNNYTVIVPTLSEKERLKRFMTKQEILTVAEIKGLERDTVILYNVLSSNYEKWKALERITLNRKTADENSVYRYYFNLFYVGVSRGKSHVYIAEEKTIPLFSDFFNKKFECLNIGAAASKLAGTSDKTEAEQDEIARRVSEFIRLSQYDNARFWVNKVLNTQEKNNLSNKIDIYESLIRFGKHREAGIRFWESGMNQDAREQFGLCGEDMLIKLLDACGEEGNKELSFDIIGFLPEVINNPPAKKLIMDTLQKDIVRLKTAQNTISQNFKNRKPQ